MSLRQRVSPWRRWRSTGKEEFLLKKEEMKAKLDEYQAIIDKHDSEKKDLCGGGARPAGRGWRGRGRDGKANRPVSVQRRVAPQAGRA